MNTWPNKLIKINDARYIYFGRENEIACIRPVFKSDEYRIIHLCGHGPVDAIDRWGKSILGKKFCADEMRGCYSHWEIEIEEIYDQKRELFV